MESNPYIVRHRERRKRDFDNVWHMESQDDTNEELSRFNAQVNKLEEVIYGIRGEAAWSNQALRQISDAFTTVSHKVRGLIKDIVVIANTASHPYWYLSAFIVIILIVLYFMAR